MSAGPPRIGYAVRALVFGALPVRPFRSTTWTRRLGPSEVQVFGAPEYGVPFGQDRALLLLACTRAVYANSREVDLGSAFAILGDLGLPPDGRNYQRMAQRLLRVCNAALIVRQQFRTPDGKPAQRSSLLCFDHAHLWCEGATPPAADDPRGVNRTRLSSDFWRELRRSFVSFPWEAVRQLSDSPANLDFYLWTIARAAAIRPGGMTAITLTGAAGLMRQLGLVYAQERDFRAKVRGWLERVRGFDPSWTAELTGDGCSLLIGHREPEHEPAALAFLRDVRAARSSNTRA
ncbi:MAG: replication protein RepA [Vicinamibacteria bacterium]|nr:replication protein RepA [Vicinamibacteria bacterium]